MKQIIIILTIVMIALLLSGCESNEPAAILSTEAALVGQWTTKEMNGECSNFTTFDGSYYFDTSDFQCVSHSECTFTWLTCYYTYNFHYTKHRFTGTTEWTDTSIYVVYEKYMNYVVTGKVITFVDMSGSTSTQNSRTGLIHMLIEDYLNLTVELAPNNQGFSGRFEFHRLNAN